MFRAGMMLAYFTALLLVVHLPQICNAVKENSESRCEPSSCGNIHNIRYPFRLTSDPPDCGDHSYELGCENNLTVVYLTSSKAKYYVQAINYDNFTIRLVDPGLHKDNCSFLPLYSINRYNISAEDLPYTTYKPILPSYTNIIMPIYFLSCPYPVNSPRYVDYTPCTKSTNFSSRSGSTTQYYNHSYVKVGSLNASDVVDWCSLDLMVLTSMFPVEEEQSNLSFAEVHTALLYGFELSWFEALCSNCSGFCYLDDHTNLLRCQIDRTTSRRMKLLRAYVQVLGPLLAIIVIGLNIAMRIVCGIPFILTVLIRKWRRRHLSTFDDVEGYLRSQNNLMPIRYSYSQIKKMTKGFKDKLGEGGYGSVYKGKLRSGGLVAIKILGKSNANGQEFISEVVTIGRIHHVNVVQLIGYCAESSKRALVYDFMPNGSLEKYIFPREEGTLSLSCEKMYEVSLGVARGIEYLHRGCDMQILHFDIKPHNILLDENFTPKVSDFGLAKLYPTDDSIVSLTAARGTMGYMAPELFYKNIGGVSYKADVYSFGTLLLEMAGRRKNLNVFADHSSQIYFPSWVYDQIMEGKDIEVRCATEEEMEVVKKMIIVALWCIQMKPIDRPSMSKVVEMLEGNVEVLHMPPKPFLTPEDMPAKYHGINTHHTELPILSLDSTYSINLDIST